MAALLLPMFAIIPIARADERPLIPCTIRQPTGVQPFGNTAPNLWPGGIVPYGFDPNVTPANQAAILVAMAEWSARANVTFVPWSGQTEYLYIQDGPTNSSWVGMIPLGQVVEIFNWNFTYIMVHELGHALGLWHEHQRFDAPTYVFINYANIQPIYAFNYNPVGTPFGPYDFHSVMHYDPCAFSTACGMGQTCACPPGTEAMTPIGINDVFQHAMGRVDHLSFWDGLTMAHLYGGMADCNTNTTPDIGEWIDCDTNGTLDICDTIGGSNDCNTDRTPDACQLKPLIPFSSTSSFMQNIPDGVTVTSTLGGGPTATVRDVNVFVDLRHTWDSDLVLRVIHSGVTVSLASNDGGDGHHFARTIFDDSAVLAITSSIAKAPFVGTFRPKSPLSAFNGLSSSGSWQLRIFDTGPGDTGTLLMWSITVSRHGVADCDTNNTLDVCEIMFRDCNTNNTIDVCDTTLGGVTDCNTNTFPDVCEFGDCNTNNTLDLCDVTLAGFTDCNTNFIPDPCEFGDCNTNSQLDLCETIGGADDCNTNRSPDVCERSHLDADTNNTLDPCDILAGAGDCNSNGVLDAVETSSLSIDWVRRFPSRTPKALAASYWHLAYDSIRNKSLLFGGYSEIAFDFSSQTWEWDGQDWTRKPTPVHPTARGNSAIVFDSFRGVVVLFGGFDQNGNDDQTWEWNGTGWTQRFPATIPTARHKHAMAYDSARHVTVLFGGTDQFITFADTWEWDGTNWTLRSPAHSPSTRYAHSMAYDVARGETVLYGGGSAVFPYPTYTDTWVWNGFDWTQRITTQNPAAPQYFSLAYDSHRQVVVQFGGNNNGSANDQTWEWNGLDWSQRIVAHPPAPRSESSMAYDAGRKRMVMFGGLAGSYVNETHELLSYASAPDCDSNATPDLCQSDANTNGTADACEGCTTCPGDVNGDGLVDGEDVTDFTACYLSGPGVSAGCFCADVHPTGSPNGVLNNNDLVAFVSSLLNRPAMNCP